MLLLGFSFTGFTWIDDCEWIIDYLDYLYRKTLSPVPCGEMWICSGAVVFLSMRKKRFILWLAVSKRLSKVRSFGD